MRAAGMHQTAEGVRADSLRGLIMELAELALDGKGAGTFFDAAYHLCVDVEGAGEGDDALGLLGRHVDLEAVAHVKDLVHFGPVGAALTGNGLEEGRHGEHVVLDDAAVFTHKVQHFGLCAARAVYHAVYFGTHLVEQTLDDGSIGASGGEHQAAGVERCALNGVGESVRSAVDKFLGHGLVVAFGIFLGQVFGKHVVACRGETVGTHAAVVLRFVGGLAAGGEAHDDVAGTDIGVVDDVAALHAAGDGAVDDDGAHEVAYVGRFAPRGVNADAHVAHLLQKFVGAVDDGGDDLAGDEHLVAADGGADKYVVDGAYAQQVVGVHDERILRDAFPHREVARFAPVHVSQARLGACAVGVHDVAVFRVAAQNVGDDFAECLGEDAFVDVLDGVVHVLLHSGDAAHHVTLLAVHGDCGRCMLVVCYMNKE